MDLEFILGVISDGPTKSLAYRRLQYLASKFDMHYLLNDFAEVADMKVRFVISCPSSWTHESKQKGPHRYHIPLTEWCEVQTPLVLGTFTTSAKLIPTSITPAA